MITSVRGTKDILPEEIPIWDFIERTLKKVSKLFGFQEIRLPIFERTEVFQRSIGENTDVVNKEMYTFLDRGGNSITLRPELTASVARALIQNNLILENSALRLWYYGPLFRYERPQKGRLRQFHQYGAELIGSSQPEADVEIILLAVEIIKELGIKEYTLLLNSIGSSRSRQNYRKALVSYLNQHSSKLSKESQERLKRNPLRILDSKDPQDFDVIQNSPIIYEYLDKESTEHYETTKDLLKTNNIPFKENPFLVRGLDYYTHTVFEFQNNYLGAQDSFGGGGRYNELLAQFGARKNIPAIGFALGIERIILILESQSIKLSPENTKIFVAYNNQTYIPKVIELAHKLRQLGLSTIFDLQKNSLKSQLKEANKNLVDFAVLVCDEEVKSNSLSIKNMKDGSQINLPFDQAIEFLLKSSS